MKTAVLGTGAWGTALAQVLADNGHEVWLWGVEKDQVDDLNINHKNTRCFGDKVLPAVLKATMDMEEAVKDVEAIVVAVPTFAVASSIKKAAQYMPDKTLIISVAKGFDHDTTDFIPDTIRKSLPASKHSAVVILAGPSFAVEVADRLPTAVTATGPHLLGVSEVQELFSNDYFRVYANDDEIGAEVAGVVKNVIAIASGCLAGLGYKVNTRSALITRGLAEMARYTLSQGGRLSTVYGLTGVGDLVLSCSSDTSRNYQLGYAIAKDGDAKKVLSANKLTTEGVKGALILHQKAQAAKVEMPICEGIYQVLYHDAKVEVVVRALMDRPLRFEAD